ncbi:hypothetical protein [Kluyvera intermedia]|uniref:hypothetical protein n=1 Tax=Kluyvera intermedia TaxID=61648 RepID=UPI003D0383A5
MDLLEVSVRLERIGLLAKISHFDDVTPKEKTVALTWIGEITEILKDEVSTCSQLKQSSEQIESILMLKNGN